MNECFELKEGWFSSRVHYWNFQSGHRSCIPDVWRINTMSAHVGECKTGRWKCHSNQPGFACHLVSFSTPANFIIHSFFIILHTTTIKFSSVKFTLLADTILQQVMRKRLMGG